MRQRLKKKIYKFGFSQKKVNMKKVSGNEVAKLIAQLEGKKISLSIAQIKEVLSIIAKICHDHPPILAWLIMHGYKKK